MSGCLYLNNDGSRWIIPGDMDFILVLPDGTKKQRKAICYESFGNFATTIYRYQGKRYAALPKAHDGSEIRDPDAKGQDALPHVWHEKAASLS